MTLCFSLTSVVNGDAGTTGAFVGCPPGLACRLLTAYTISTPLPINRTLICQGQQWASLLIVLFSGFTAARGGHVAHSGQ